MAYRSEGLGSEGMFFAYYTLKSRYFSWLENFPALKSRFSCNRPQRQHPHINLLPFKFRQMIWR